MRTQPFDLGGRRALVTGGSRGIGLAIARGLGIAGAEIILNGRNAEALASAVADLSSEGIVAAYSVFDVTDRAAVERAIAVIEDRHGPVDILVNNAGMQHRGALEDFPEDAWHRLMALNLDAVFFVAQEVARAMIPRRRGVIINIASVQSELARPGIAPYTASKGAVKMLTKGMATDWGRHGIRVNAIAPGYFRTELNAALVADPAFSAWIEDRTPLARWGDVEELAGAAVFLASDAATYVTGHILAVDGGITARL
ncbi:glucose 1-dehydrogenase [Mesorhizobium sp. BE184]|uniref:glucose 1-dehydrogenase n=1 Tax=Mesorhizobium sp. BE184 TaxID=2817714 RepID=UPI00285BCD00|nr:glucose 1-dehydrogenase [Mesorhizobium sp. BE184]MDR7033161.1 gluconate 5-dehydrogenase [Mesorhizobium sp. BE184]